jgi:hypothetical protein
VLLVIERRRWPEQDEEEVVLEAVEETLSVAVPVIRFRLTYFIRQSALLFTFLRPATIPYVPSRPSSSATKKAELCTLLTQVCATGHYR